jgi:hypothetical protein
MKDKTKQNTTMDISVTAFKENSSTRNDRKGFLPCLLQQLSKHNLYRHGEKYLI